MMETEQFNNKRFLRFMLLAERASMLGVRCRPYSHALMSHWFRVSNRWYARAFGL